MKLKKLLKDIPVKDIKGSKDVEITGVCANSKVVAPGNLFIAKPGRTTHGAQYIPQVIAAGAAAVVTDMYDPSIKEITQIVHPDVASIEGLLAARYHNNPSAELFMTGVTGTNGKTSVSYYIKHLLDNGSDTCGLIGTIESIICGCRYPATHTTPDVCENHKMLRDMLIHGCTQAVMEVTSHALDQGRVNNIHFDVGVFTNLSQDHLDYHGTMECYCAAKKKLFAADRTKKAVVNRDDLWAEKILEGSTADTLTYGIDSAADIVATQLEPSDSGTRFILTYRGESLSCMIPVIGRHSVYNALAAVGVALCAQLPLATIVSRLATLPCVAGRLEPVAHPLEFKVFVDFAHTEDALRHALTALRELTSGRLIAVFGCGGDRDKDKRAKMGAVSEKLATFTFITSDNPRSEDPKDISQAIADGFMDAKAYSIVTDRKEAIAAAIEMAQPGDCILIAGKGHERQQISRHQTVPFDDRKVAAAICEQLVAAK
ncbi:MAG: UDP-N-acetylmuramoyl-L-alanyl-D-glutamate--2,6-diaminopimelate ligase [Chlamydiales bacterium]|nr:UDP-N-acetylmuramoyl-L-alanyl-D-glutamate--2,6-diaminopimelate ligase [Chlamydiales bacterium]